MFPRHIQREIDAAAAEEESLQRGWPEVIALRLWRQSPWYELAYAFLPAFPSLSPAEVRPLAVFGRLFANSIFVHDPLADREVAARDAATSSLRIMAMQFEAYHQLHPLFPPDAPFWGRLRRYLSEYAAACMEEHAFASGARPWQEYGEDLALRVAVGKSGPSRAIVAGLVELAREESLLGPLVDALNHFNIACQMWDDLNDWREDLRYGMPSLLLSRVLPRRPAEEGVVPEVDHLAREIYYGGHAGYTLGLALASLEAADRVRSLAPDLPWYRSIDIMRRKYQATLLDTNRIIEQNVRRVRAQPRFSLALPEPEAPWQRAAFSAARFLVRQWQLGFGEARDMVEYPDDAGQGTGCHYGDVFQRALAVDALCDLDGVLGARLQTVIEHEIDYLLSCRSTSGVGGWIYFHDMRWLPPDADDLAQVMQALLRSGHRGDVAAHCEAPLAVLLRDLALPDGSFKTWIIPAGQRTPDQERQASFVQSSDTAHEEVVANLLYALTLYDEERFGETIQRGIGYLEARQHEGGWWASRWYYGPYYGVYVCARLFAASNPGSIASRRALDFLRSCQQPDGGWRVAPDGSDPLSTALALLALAAGREGAGEAGDPRRAAQAIAYLESTRGEDGAWPTRKLICVGRETFTGSRTMTTIFVMKAALAWRQPLTCIESTATHPGSERPR